MFNDQKIKSLSFLQNNRWSLTRRQFLTIFLLFCVASSKGIIIYNEETLVALSFGLFVIFCSYYFGNTLKESLDERSLSILNGLENFHRIKEESLQNLLSFHKRSLHLQKYFSSLKQDFETRVSHLDCSVLIYGSRSLKKKQSFAKGKKKISTAKSLGKKKVNSIRLPLVSINLYNNISEKIIQKLEVFKSSKAVFHQSLQNSIAFYLNESVVFKTRTRKQDVQSN